MQRRSMLLAMTAILTPSLALAEAINTAGGAAIQGYDPVAYFTRGQPTRGNPAINTGWNGAEWRFASEANRAAFLAAPERYAPQFGGFCAYAVSEGYTATIDPRAWRIEGGRLYLNYSARIQRTWEQDIPGRVSRANGHWERLGQAPRG